MRHKPYKNLTLSTMARIKEIAMIVNSYNVDNKLSKSLIDIYLERIKDKYFISERTFKRYISFAREYLGYEFKTSNK